MGTLTSFSMTAMPRTPSSPAPESASHVEASRETATERSERLRSLNKTAVACPKCGYNLTGLQGTRCPECGTLYTIDELLAEQPSRADRDMND